MIIAMNLLYLITVQAKYDKKNTAYFAVLTDILNVFLLIN